MTGSFEQRFKDDDGEDAEGKKVLTGGFSDAEKVKIKAALKAQKELLENKLSELKSWSESDKEKFQSAFGKLDDASKLNIQKRVERMLALNAKFGLGNFKKADPKATPETDPASLYAYVYPDDTKEHTIYVGEAFWKAPMKGDDSMAGTLSHEMSHFEDIGDTNDSFPSYKSGIPVYGTKASQALAKARPDLALKHADSYQYWVEDQ